jgi:hypothetical protein
VTGKRSSVLPNILFLVRPFKGHEVIQKNTNTTLDTAITICEFLSMALLPTYYPEPAQLIRLSILIKRTGRPVFAYVFDVVEGVVTIKCISAYPLFVLDTISLTSFGSIYNFVGYRSLIRRGRYTLQPRSQFYFLVFPLGLLKIRILPNLWSIPQV